MGLQEPTAAVACREDDNRFVRACQRGDAAAWEALVKRHTRRVYGMCYRFTRSECEASDLTQEVFLRVFRTLGGFRAEELSFIAWLNLLTRNLLIDHYRRARNERLTVSLDLQVSRTEPAPSGGRGPDSLLAMREVNQVLAAALMKLSPELRETIILYDLRELKYREIASVLRIPTGTVKSRLNKGRATLSRLLRCHPLAA